MNARVEGRSLGRWVRQALASALALAVWTPASASAYDLGPQFSLHGFFDMEYHQASAFEGMERGDASDPSNGAFRQHHVNFFVDARVRPDLVAKAHIEMEYGADTELGYGGIILEYGFIDYALRGDLLRLRAGKLLTPFGFYNEIHDSSPAFLSVSIPWVLYKGSAMGGFSALPKWITGLSFTGGYDLPKGHHDLNYALYIGNGESVGSNDHYYDDNPNKAVGARVEFVTHKETFKAALSGYYGDKAVTPEKRAEQHSAAVLSLEYAPGPLNIHGEYAWAAVAGWRESVWYLMASYRLGKLTPYARYQFIDPDDEEGNDTWGAATGGINYLVNSNLIFKAEHTIHDRGSENLAIAHDTPDFSETQVALTLFF
ncbi:MAG: porin [Nitrospinae bacterium]|nr:porin [Nitrospinota bacterium]